MSTINNISQNGEDLAIFVPGLGAVLPDSVDIGKPSISVEELVALSTITQTPIEEILKPIDFPYWSL